MTNQLYAKIALWLDDPYGDGIRLQAIREPSVARLAAQLFVRTDQMSLSGDEEEYIRIGKEYVKSPANVRYLKRQGVLA